MLLCHIVGLNNNIKKQFIDFCEGLSDKLIIEDIDDISRMIMNNKDYLVLLSEYHNPDSIGNRKDILHKMSLIWKDTMIKEINNIVTINDDKYVILLGLSNYVMDQRIKIDIPTKNTFFINIDPELNGKQIIGYNIDNFREQIINGKFPLDYLNLTFLRNQREVLRDLYAIKGYSLKRYDSVLRWLSNKIKNVDLDKVYFASFKRYDNNINTKEQIIGYTTKWLAMVSLFPKESIKRGVSYATQNECMKPLIKELCYDAFTSLQRPCYVYELSPQKKVDNYRYLVDGTIFEKREYISDIYDELYRLGAKLEKYTIM